MRVRFKDQEPVNLFDFVLGQIDGDNYDLSCHEGLHATVTDLTGER